MTDDYFDWTAISPVVRALSSQVDDLGTAVQVAFDKVPAESDLKEGVVNYSPDTGIANAYVATLNYAPASYSDGLEVCLKVAFSNSGACTLNVNGLGAKTIVNPDSTTPTAGALAAGGFAVLRYNGDTGKFVLINPANIATGASGYVTINGVETLGNKTLTAPALVSPTFSGTVTFATQSPGDNSTKPATTAYADALGATKAPIASPALTGNPTAPTKSQADNSASIATTAYVDAGLGTKAPTASPTFTGTVTDAVGDIRTAPENVQNGSYTLALTDKGKHLKKTDSTARAHTIPPNSSVAFPIGTLVTFVNMGGTTNNLTITRGGGVTLYRAGSNADVVVTPGDMVTCLKVATDTWQA